MLQDLRNCIRLRELPKNIWAGLQSLHTLRLHGCSGLSSLPPRGWGNMRALTVVDLRNCRKLEALPEAGWDGLQSLRLLDLMNCSSLRGLPATFAASGSLEMLLLDPTLHETLSGAISHQLGSQGCCVNSLVLTRSDRK